MREQERSRRWDKGDDECGPMSLKGWITLGRGVQRQLAIHTWNFDKGLRWEHSQTEETVEVVAAVKLLRESQEPLGTNLTALPSSPHEVQVEPLPHPCSLHLHIEPAHLRLPQDLFLMCLMRTDKSRRLKTWAAMADLGQGTELSLLWSLVWKWG